MQDADGVETQRLREPATPLGVDGPMVERGLHRTSPRRRDRDRAACLCTHRMAERTVVRHGPSV
jgi:hypothetical protein